MSNHSRRTVYLLALKKDTQQNKGAILVSRQASAGPKATTVKFLWICPALRYDLNTNYRWYYLDIIFTHIVTQNSISIFASKKSSPRNYQPTCSLSRSVKRPQLCLLFLCCYAILMKQFPATVKTANEVIDKASRSAHQYDSNKSPKFDNRQYKIADSTRKCSTKSLLCSEIFPSILPEARQEEHRRGRLQLASCRYSIPVSEPTPNTGCQNYKSFPILTTTAFSSLPSLPDNNMSSAE